MAAHATRLAACTFGIFCRGRFHRTKMLVSSHRSMLVGSSACGVHSISQRPDGGAGGGKGETTGGEGGSEVQSEEGSVNVKRSRTTTPPHAAEVVCVCVSLREEG